MARTPVKLKRKNAFHTLPEEPVEARIYEIDAIELLQSLPDESIDLVVTDPAYESLEKWRATGTTTRLKQSKGSSNKWFKTFPNMRYSKFFREMWRVMKSGSLLYMFCDEETRDIVTTGFSPQTGKKLEAPNETQSILFGDQICTHSPLLSAGFKYWKAIIWDKVHPGMGYHWPAQHEFIILAEKVWRKGKHKKIKRMKYDADGVNRPPGVGVAAGDVLRVTRLKGKKYYPTEKPQKLIELLIEASCEEGDTVLDPFCGSGVVGVACTKLKRHFILGDIDAAEAKKRLT